MMRVALVRGKYLNIFEGQNYIFEDCDIDLVGISSVRPIHTDFSFPIIKLPSPADIRGAEKIIKVVFNRTLGDSQILLGLEKYATQFDIFHTADPHYYYSYQLAKLRSEGKIKKLLVTSWEIIPFNNENLAAKKGIKHFILKHADHFLCYTDLAKKCLMTEGVSSEKITVMKLGVDLKKFQIPKFKLQTNSKFQKAKTLHILFVGRLVEEKGVMDLYEAFKRVTCNVKRVTFKIVGEGPLKHNLLKKIKTDHLEHLVSIEKKSYKEMPKVYENADLFILPSKRTKTWEEQYGMVLVEAMASGLPIVAYDTGAIREIMDSAGVYIHEGDIGGLAFAIRHLMADRAFAAKLGTMGRRRAESEFDSRKSAKKIEQLYESII